MTISYLVNRDCVQGMAEISPGTIDLAFADPPFNIDYKYDIYKDNITAIEYLGWSRTWMSQVHAALKPDGAFWLAIGDERAAELVVVAKSLGFHMRNWVIWHYTFGVHCTTKFTRSHAHLLYFAKDPKRFTFNDDAIRVPSKRQTVYKDSRANPAGRVPDDTWEFSRVCGTFRERQGWHPCQMPEAVLERIILACSNPGETVLDPFSGSGTTLAVAKRTGRNAVGFEISSEYVDKAEERIASVNQDVA